MADARCTSTLSTWLPFHPRPHRASPAHRTRPCTSSSRTSRTPPRRSRSRAGEPIAAEELALAAASLERASAALAAGVERAAYALSTLPAIGRPRRASPARQARHQLATSRPGQRPSPLPRALHGRRGTRSSVRARPHGRVMSDRPSSRGLPAHGRRAGGRAPTAARRLASPPPTRRRPRRGSQSARKPGARAARPAAGRAGAAPTAWRRRSSARSISPAGRRAARVWSRLVPRRAAQRDLERIAMPTALQPSDRRARRRLVSELISDGTGPVVQPGDESPAARPGSAGSALPRLTKQPRSGALDHGRELCRQRRRKWWTTALGRRSRVNTPFVAVHAVDPTDRRGHAAGQTAWRHRSSAIPRAKPPCSAVA